MTASIGTMEWFQQADTEQKEKVNGCAEPPEGESGGSDSCGGTSASEVTDLQELKAPESEGEEDKEEREGVPASKAEPSERARKKSEDGEEHKQKSSATSTYTGELRTGLRCSRASEDFTVICGFRQTCRTPHRRRCRNSCVSAEKTARGRGSAWSVRSAGTRRLASITGCTPARVVRYVHVQGTEDLHCRKVERPGQKGAERCRFPLRAFSGEPCE